MFSIFDEILKNNLKKIENIAFFLKICNISRLNTKIPGTTGENRAIRNY